MLFYLSGAIEHAPDHGRAWRAALTPILRKLGHDVYDPVKDEDKGLPPEDVANFRAWKSSDPERFRRVLKHIISWDLDWIDRCDAVLCYWDEHAGRGAGTQGELTYAFRNDVPVYLVTPLPQTTVSGWILGCATHIFPDFNALHAHLTTKAMSVAAQ